MKIYWARVIPGSPRLVVVHGENLRAWNSGGCSDVNVGSPSDKEPSATLDGTALLHRYFSGAESHDWNRCGHRVAFFEIPSSVGSGDLAFIYTPSGSSALPTLTLATPAAAYSPALYPSGAVQEIDEPIVVDDGQSLDLAGDLVCPSASFAGAALLLVHDGATVKNGIIDCGKTNAFDAINLVGTGTTPPTGITLQNLRILNDYDGGVHSSETKAYGIESTFGATNCKFLDLYICADRCAETGPTQTVNSNTWVRCEFTGPRASFDSTLGRLVNGGKNCMLWCHWHDIDRGVNMAPFAGPLAENLFWECRQLRTGFSVGASEGTMYENDSAEEVMPASIDTSGPLTTMTIPTSTSNYTRNIKRGNYVYDPTTHDLKRIAADPVLLSEPGATRYQVLLEGKFKYGTGKVLVGNLFTKNTFARCRFENGAKGLVLFGLSNDNFAVQCQFVDLDTAILWYDRVNKPIRSFYFQRCSARRCGEVIRRQVSGYTDNADIVTTVTPPETV